MCVCVHLSVRYRCSCSVRENGRLNLGSADWPIRDCFHVTCGSQFTLPQLSVPLFLSLSSLSASVHTTLLSVSSTISSPFSSSHSICSLSLSLSLTYSLLQPPSPWKPPDPRPATSQSHITPLIPSYLFYISCLDA